MADKNKVRFGISNMHIAFFADDSAAKAPKWGDYIPIPGSVGFTPEAQDSETVFYADNRAYYSSLDSDRYTGDLESALIPDAVLAQMFGWALDSLGGLLQVQGGEKKSFALAGQIEGDKSGRRFVYYNCTASVPAEQGATTTETKTVQTQTMSVAMDPLEIDDTRVATKYTIPYDADTAGNATVYNDFFKAVYVPPIPEEETP